MAIDVLRELFYNKTLQHIELQNDDGILLDFENGCIVLWLDPSCGESLSFEDCGDPVQESVGLPLVFADLVDGGEEREDEYDVHEGAFLNLKFAAGSKIVNVSYTAHNHHNGCYGGFHLNWQVALPGGRLYTELDRLMEVAAQAPVESPVQYPEKTETDKKALALWRTE